MLPYREEMSFDCWQVHNNNDKANVLPVSRWEIIASKTPEVVRAHLLSPSLPVLQCAVGLASYSYNTQLQNMFLYDLDLSPMPRFNKKDYYKENAVDNVDMSCLPENQHLGWLRVTFLGDFSSLSWAYFLCNQAEILICCSLSLLQCCVVRNSWSRVPCGRGHVCYLAHLENLSFDRIDL